MGLRYFLILILIMGLGCAQPGRELASSPITHQSNDAPTDEGQETGNGADYVSADARSAWFLGRDKTIEVCIDSDPNFAKTKDDLRAIIENGFLKWQTYIDFKKVNKDRDERFQMTTTVHFNSDCSDPKNDLHFYFGTRPDLMQKFKGDLDSPLAFVARTHHDLGLGWSKGFVWVAPSRSVKKYFSQSSEMVPDWSASFALNGIILHEIGHILGCDHVPGTIMTEDISTPIINSDENIRYDQLTEIDGYKELALCDTCQRVFQGQLGSEITRISTPQGNVVHDYTEQAFRDLFGRDPVGPVIAQVRMGSEGIILEVKDNKEKNWHPFEIHINAAQSIPRYVGAAYIFRAVRQIESNSTPADVYYSKDTGYSATGTLQTLPGTTLSISFDRNMQDLDYASPLSIRYSINLKTRNLFFAQWHQFKTNNLDIEMRTK